ncbi:cilia- and flagella-associated protein 69-like [Genypterus blacodes]|uniref:cilia- and flagella-associated protein 69-like n=1 Tax=Genypterus blacodes TaxID=154954 RepID=UPI003F778012
MDWGKVVQRRRPELPVMRQTTPHTRQHVSEVTTKCLELSKVIRLLEDPLTMTLKDRHIFVLKKLLKRSQNGFLLREIAGISKILNICAEKVKDQPEYIPILCEALTICRLPFLKEKVSDELTYAKDLTEFLTHIGCLMRVSDSEVRRQICDTVKSFYSCVAPQLLLDGTDRHTKPGARSLQSDSRFSRLSLGLQPTSPGLRLQLLEHSGLAQTLLLSMASLENQPAIKLQLLQTLQILSSTSDVNCALILNAQGAETICLHMNEPDPSGRVLCCSSEILWNLLEKGNKDGVTAQLSSMECIISLKEAFFQVMLNDLQHSDIKLRNDLLVIATLIAETPNSKLIESLFAKELMVLVTSPELKSHNSLVHNLKLSYNNEDFHMKKLLLNLVVVISKDFSALQLFRDSRVILALLTLVKPPAVSHEGRSGSRHWSSNQQEELQLQALATLATIAPLLLDDYMSCQGNTCLLLLLDWCVGKDAYFSQGHSFHGTGGRGSKRAQLRYCIRVLRSVTAVGDEPVNQDLCDQGIINQLLGILMQMEANTDEEDEVTVEIKSDIQLILSALCESDMHRKELFGTVGVEMVLHFLRKGSDKFYSGLGHNKLILSTVDCVWSCIVGCYTTEDYFLIKEGASLLLDLLSSSPRSVHGIVLATMLELCDNPNTLQHVLTWKDQGGQTGPRLLLRLWREEEAELGVRRDPHGGIMDTKKPLQGHYQPEIQLSFPANVPSTAVMEISENLRSKIFSVFCKLGFQDLPGLSTRDYITLCIIKRYLDLKVGEVWQEIGRELVVDHVRPVSPDEEALSTICKIAEDTARRVAAEQRSILQQHQKDDSREEELMYKEIKLSRKQEELTAKSWNHYVSKTSNYNILKEVKAQRDSSRPKPKHEDAATEPVQHFVAQVMNMEKTAAQGPAGMKVTLSRTSIRGATSGGK